MRKSILFDLDGTLIDSTEAILDGFCVAFKENNAKMPEEKVITSLIGHPLDIMFLNLGIKNEDIKKYVTSYKRYYTKICKDKTTLLEFAKEAVDRAYEIADLGVVTTKTSKYSDELLKFLDIRDKFKILIGREDVKNPKPSAEPILKAMKALGAKPEYTYMIGDTCLDMNSAKNAGIKGIAVLCGYGSEESLQKCTNFIEKNPLDAVKFIETQK